MRTAVMKTLRWMWGVLFSGLTLALFYLYVWLNNFSLWYLYDLQSLVLLLGSSLICVLGSLRLYREHTWKALMRYGLLEKGLALVFCTLLGYALWVLVNTRSLNQQGDALSYIVLFPILLLIFLLALAPLKNHWVIQGLKDQKPTPVLLTQHQRWLYVLGTFFGFGAFGSFLWVMGGRF